MSGAFVRGNRDKPEFLKTSSYALQVEAARDICVILYCTSSQRAWLVDGASALLHIVRAQVERKPYHTLGCLDQNSGFDPVKFDHPLPNAGPGAAVEALLKESNMKHVVLREFESYENEKVENKTLQENEQITTSADAATVDRKEVYKITCFKDLVTQAWGTLEQIHDRQMEFETTHATKQIKSPFHECLEGYEIMDIVASKRVMKRRFIELNENGQDWMKIAKGAHAITLFGQGFGEIYRPVQDSGGLLCRTWQCVPCHQQYLAVPMVLLSEIKKRCWEEGEVEAQTSEITEGVCLRLSKEAFKLCGKDCNHSFGRVQRFQKGSNTRGAWMHKTDWTTHSGAIIIGKTSKLSFNGGLLSPQSPDNARDIRDSGLGSSMHSSTDSDSGGTEYPMTTPPNEARISPPAITLEGLTVDTASLHTPPTNSLRDVEMQGNDSFVTDGTRVEKRKACDGDFTSHGTAQKRERKNWFKRTSRLDNEKQY